MQSADLSLISDGCSLSPDGIPTFLGGNGHEWLHCCVAHDLSALQLADHIQLARCIAATGHPVVASAFLAAVILFCGTYVAVKRRLGKRRAA